MNAPFAVARTTSGRYLSEIIAEYRLCALPSADVMRCLATAGVDLAALIRRWQTRPLDIPRIDRVIFTGARVSSGLFTRKFICKSAHDGANRSSK